MRERKGERGNKEEEKKEKEYQQNFLQNDELI